MRRHTILRGLTHPYVPYPRKPLSALTYGICYRELIQFVLGDTKRKNITEGQPGFPLYLDILVMNTLTCEPLVGAIVDFWHVRPFYNVS